MRVQFRRAALRSPAIPCRAGRACDESFASWQRFRDLPVGGPGGQL